MTTSGGTRSEQKERTRRAILDAALRLTEETGFRGLSLRQVTREVGIVPTGFYRHFASLDEVGLALVDESFQSLRAMVREVRQGQPEPRAIIAASVTALVEHVRAQRSHFGFIAREWLGGSPVVREAIARELGLFERELATDLARLPMRHWSTEDLQVLANLIVNAMVATAHDLLEAGGRPAAEEAIRARAERQLRMVVVGARQWRSDHTDD